MADTGDDPIASWHDKVASLRKRGRVSGAALAVVPASASDRYLALARLHRQSATLAATLATRLRLTPHSKLGKNQPTDGGLPVG